jgi:hypothetical protein
LTVSYGEEQKKPDTKTQQPQKVEQFKRIKKIFGCSRKGEQVSSNGKETARKKIPAFWFLLPEK